MAVYKSFHHQVQVQVLRPSDDAKRETEPQRIKRFQGYLLQFMQWHDIKPCRV